MGSSQQFSLRWNNYLKHITCAFDTLRTDEDLVDVTLSCEGKRIRAHKMLLSACSTYFRDLFKENPCQHPVIIFRNVKFDDLAALVDFMYQGEVNVVQEQLASFLTTAELLAVQGLTDGTGKDNDSLVEEEVEIPNEPEVQLQNQLSNMKSNAKGNKSPSSPYHQGAELQAEIPQTKRRKCRDNSNLEKTNALANKDAMDNKNENQTTIGGSDPVEIIPLMPNLKLEMPEYLEQDGSSCSYDEQNTDGLLANKMNVDMDNTADINDDQKPDISQTFYSNQSTSDSLDSKLQTPDLAYNSSGPSEQSYQLNFPWRSYVGLQLKQPEMLFTDLDKFLSNDSDGKIILSAYGKEKELSKHMRNLLVQTVIRRERDIILSPLKVGDYLQEFDVSTTKLQAYAKDIATLFKENENLYFTPYYSAGNVRKNPSGKLLEHMNYVKKFLKSVGILVSSSACYQQPQFEHKSSLTDAEIEEKLTWLQNNVQPWDEVICLWKETLHIRRDKFQKEETTICEYFQQYKALREERGYELINYDFNQLYPGKGTALFDKWEKLRQCLFKTLLDVVKFSEQPEVRNLIEMIPRLSRVNQDAIIIYLLPYIVIPTQQSYVPPLKRRRMAKKDPETTGPKVKGKRAKPSLESVQNSFVLHVKNAADLDETIETMRRDLHSKEQKLQPLMVYVGDLTNLDAVYAIVDSTRYQLRTSVHALDLVFKIFHATDCEYPQTAFHIWLFLQKVVYGIVHVGDKFGLNLTALIGQIEKDLYEG